MAKDVLITPSLGKVDFKDTDVSQASIYESTGDLHIDANGTIILGDGTPANLELGATGVPVSLKLLGGGDITTLGGQLNVGLTGDVVNLNVTGVTYNLPSNIITTADYTVNDILTKIKSVDGAGSGLDADTLEGKHLSELDATYVNSSGDTLTGNLTIGNGTTQTILTLNNAPLDSNLASRIEFRISDGQHIQLRHNSHDTIRAPFGLHLEKTADNAQTTNKAYLDVEGDIYANGGNKVWHQGNDGAASGLDADLLDGNQASAFALASHTQAASTITDFDTEVSNNTNVAANTSARHSHTNKAILDATTASFTTADETKLDGIATGANNYSLPVATASVLGGIKSGTDITIDGSGNVSVNDSSHAHTIANITSLQTSLDAKVNSSLLGAVSGVATLDASGTIPTAQLPSFVNDVLEYATYSVFPVTGETGKLYVDTTTNLTYRWSGSAYIKLSSPLDLGETSSTAYAGDKGALVTTNLTNHIGSTGSAHGAATTSVNGFMSSTDKSKLDAIESGATADMTASEILTSVKTVDGASSGLDSDLLDGQHGSYYSPSTHNHSGVYEPVISSGTTAQYYRGDKSWQTLNASVVGLGNVTNESKATMFAGATLTGVPVAPTAVAGTNTTQIATTAFVSTAVSNLVSSAPGTLDTLNELAAALGDDPNFATTVTNSIAGKQPLDADLTAIAGLAGTSGFLKKTAADTWSLDTTSYSTTAHNHDSAYLSLAGGTLTGNLNITKNAARLILNESDYNTYNSGLEFKNGAGQNCTMLHEISDGELPAAGQGILFNGGGTPVHIVTDGEFYAYGNKVWHVGNDGAGSGLDSDKLDGQEGSYYAPVASPTFTGTVTAPIVKATGYFVTPTMVGQGDNSAYYHRVDFGYAGNDKCDFYEYGGAYNFYQNTVGTKVGANLIFGIAPTGVSSVGTVQGTRLISTAATGTAPFTVASTTKVENLNADFVDGAQINNTGTTSSDLWTADKIITEISSNLPTGAIQYSNTITAPFTANVVIPATPDYKTNGVEVLRLNGTRWDRAIHGIDYIYGFTTESNLQIDFLTSGDYKVNYTFVTNSNVSWTASTTSEPLNQNLNDTWLQEL